jgi:hypothetical protein
MNLFGLLRVGKNVWLMPIKAQRSGDVHWLGETREINKIWIKNFVSGIFGRNIALFIF